MTKLAQLEKEYAAAMGKAQKLEAKIQKLKQSKPTKNICDKIKDYNSILKISKVTVQDDLVKVKGFNTKENDFLSSIIRKMRTVKIYNEGWLPKRGENRWYPYYSVSSGFAFHAADYGVSDAITSSAARLSLREESLVRDYDKKFRYLEEEIVELP